MNGGFYFPLSPIFCFALQFQTCHLSQVASLYIWNSQASNSNLEATNKGTCVYSYSQRLQVQGSYLLKILKKCGSILCNIAVLRQAAT